MASAEETLLKRILAGGGTKTKSGVHVTPDSALRVATIFDCIQVLAQDIGKLPLVLHRRKKNGGKERATDHRAYRLMHARPNGLQTPYQWKSTSVNHIALRGNAYGFKVRVGGQIREVLPIHPDRVTVTRDEKLRPTYRISGLQDDFGPGDILQLPGLFSLDGFNGVTPITYARESIGLALAMEAHGAKTFGNAARASGVLQVPDELDDEAHKRLKEDVEEQISGDNALRILILEGGAKWDQLSMTAEDTQFVQGREFQAYEIARWFRMQPHKVGILGKATFSNIEQQALEYVGDTILPWATAIEERLNVELLSDAEQEEYFFEFLLDALLRGDIKSRYEAYGRAVLTGWMNRNEVRQRENLNPADGLDTFLEPTNMDPAGGRGSDSNSADA